MDHATNAGLFHPQVGRWEIRVQKELLPEASRHGYRFERVQTLIYTQSKLYNNTDFCRSHSFQLNSLLETNPFA